MRLIQYMQVSPLVSSEYVIQLKRDGVWTSYFDPPQYVTEGWRYIDWVRKMEGCKEAHVDLKDNEFRLIEKTVHVVAEYKE